MPGVRGGAEMVESVRIGVMRGEVTVPLPPGGSRPLPGVRGGTEVIEMSSVRDSMESDVADVGW